MQLLSRVRAFADADEEGPLLLPHLAADLQHVALIGVLSLVVRAREANARLDRQEAPQRRLRKNPEAAAIGSLIRAVPPIVRYDDAERALVQDMAGEFAGTADTRQLAAHLQRFGDKISRSTVVRILKESRHLPPKTSKAEATAEAPEAPGSAACTDATVATPSIEPPREDADAKLETPGGSWPALSLRPHNLSRRRLARRLGGLPVARHDPQTLRHGRHAPTPIYAAPAHQMPIGPPRDPEPSSPRLSRRGVEEYDR